MPIRIVAFFCVLVAGGLALLLVAASHAFVATPSEYIREVIDQTLAVIEDPTLDTVAKEERLRQIIKPKLDFDAITKHALDRHYLPQARRVQEFTLLFQELLERTYVQKIWLKEAKGARVEYLGEFLDGSSARVDTKIVTAKGNDIAVSYQLHQISAEWKVYDILILGVSLVNNYRAQFDRFLTKKSFDALLTHLREKLAKPEDRR